MNIKNNGCLSDGEFFLLRRIPAVLRARGFRLYLSDGYGCQGNRRLVDLWLNGGAAIMGHTPPNQLRELKNAASRGLYAPFPHFTEGRYLKALSKLFPKSSLRLYAAPPQELVSLFNTGSARLWRPFEEPVTQESSQEASSFMADNVPLFVPVLPGIQTWRSGLPLGLCVTVSNPVCGSAANMLAELPASDVLSPVLLAAAARGVHDIIAAAERAKPVFAKLTKVLQKSRWQRRGIYLSLKEEATDEAWEMLFNQFLQAGFLLPPVQSHPLILPGELSAGEEAKLASALSA